MLAIPEAILQHAVMPSTTYPRRIFLSAVGLTPQVVTECGGSGFLDRWIS